MRFWNSLWPASKAKIATLVHTHVYKGPVNIGFLDVIRDTTGDYVCDCGAGVEADINDTVLRTWGPNKETEYGFIPIAGGRYGSGESSVVRDIKLSEFKVERTHTFDRSGKLHPIN